MVEKRTLKDGRSFSLEALQSKTKRAQIPAHDLPHFAPIERGVHIGYRKAPGEMTGWNFWPFSPLLPQIVGMRRCSLQHDGLVLVLGIVVRPKSPPNILQQEI